MPEQKNQESNQNSYWIERMILLEALLHSYSEEAVKEISKAYRDAIREVEKDIAKWYTRYATENGISYAEAKKILSTRDLAEFKWDINDYIKYAKENGVSGAWEKELERASVRYHVSRLEALLFQLQNAAENFIAKEYSSTNKFLTNTYMEGYYRTLFEINKRYPIISGFNILDEKQVHSVLTNPWSADGLNFSKRIWGNHRAKLVSTLKQELTRQLIGLQSPKTTVNAILKRFDVARANAETLVYTESAAIGSMSLHDSFKELGIKKYRIIATLDMRTCERCRDMDHKEFAMSDFELGITAPPFHPRCRCTFGPVVDGATGGVRTAREGGNGKKWVEVPGNMTYREWYEKYVEKR